MKFLTKLFGGSSSSASKAAVAPQRVQPGAEPTALTPRPSDAQTLKAVAEQVNEAAAESKSIWDMEDDSAAEAAAAAAPAKNRRRRNATRIVGFDNSDGDVVDLFDQGGTKSEQKALQFPVGWLLVVQGDGRGHCFGLTTGLNQVGRGDTNAIQLDFGDNAISRQNHFSVVYDEEERKFLLGHGGKSNIIRLNGKAVISNEDLADGDKIKVGSTVLQLKVLCGADFDWSETAGDDEEGHDDVAIA